MPYQKLGPSMDRPPVDLSIIKYELNWNDDWDLVIKMKKWWVQMYAKPNKKSPTAINGFVKGPLPNDIP